ncbi:MAG TPA: hypothetical protein VF886_01205 [Roseiarcus sp.]
MLAYTFGLRHAFDADHIAAIDNVTRKLMQEGKRPVAVGLLLLARPFDDRGRAVDRNRGYSYGASTEVRQPHQRRRRCRHAGFGVVPVRHRHCESSHSRIDLSNLSNSEERRQIRRGRPRSHAVQSAGSWGVSCVAFFT